MTQMTRRELLASGAAVAASTAFPLAAQTASPADALLATIADELIASYPENATIYGLDKGAGAKLKARLADRSRAADQARLAWAKKRLADLGALDRSGVATETALSLDVAQAALTYAIKGYAFPYGDVAVLTGQNSYRNTPYTVSQLSGAFVDQPDFLDSRHVIETAADAEAYLSRLGDYAGELLAENERITADAAQGVILPDFLGDMVIRQIAVARAEPIERWGIVRSLADRAAKSGLKGDYAAKATKIARDKVAPAMDRQLTALRNARARASSEAGIWKLRDGDAYYAWALSFATTTKATPDEMHRLGMEQAKALQAEMDRLLKAQGLTSGSVGDRLTALAKRPDLLFPNTDAGREQLLAYLNGCIAKVRTRLPQAFATMVKGNLLIKRVPPSIQDGMPNGYASAGTIDGSQPGIYYVNLKDTGIWPRYSLPTLCHHEGIPGHVWQGEYANRLPLIRTYLAFNAYSEGWGLYAEQLGSELGVYADDPLGQIGFLQSIAFRACRLVVDTGIHAKRWTPTQAVDWFQANTGMPRGQLVSEVNRYCAMPGQACGYKMGHNEMLRLREKAKTKLGARFDLRAFDDQLVLHGNMPLTLMESVIDRHIAAAGA